MPKNLVIDPINDTEYYLEVRDLLGVTEEDLSDTTLKSDIVLGAAEREVCGSIENWMDILNGSNPVQAAALRSCIVIRVAFNIVDSPAVQNILIDKTRFPDLAMESKAVTIEEVKSGLIRMFDKQLAQTGVVYSGGWPDRTAIAKTDTYNVYEGIVGNNGSIRLIGT